jgi:TDG/mug DNA glycosylase family protein
VGPLPDYLPRRARVLFVGLNPGMRSAAVGHHFAGATNKFWRLMVDAGFLPPGSSWINDRDLPRLQLGITNLVARATPGVTDLTRSDYERGARAALEKIRMCRPRIVALVGITVYRELFGVRGPVSCGLAAETLDGALVWVLPNPSGRNAHFSYAEMLRHFRALKRRADDF